MAADRTARRLRATGRLGALNRRAPLLGWLLGLIPAGVLLYAAIMKGLDPVLFAEQISGHKVTPASWSAALAHFFIAVELLIGFALVLRLWPRWTHLSFVALMLGFIGVTAIAWASGNARDCGCFGRAAARGPQAVIVEDFALIVLSVICLWLLRGVRTKRWVAIAGLALVPFVLAFTAFGARMPADQMVTGLTPGKDLSDMPIEDLRVPHTEGRCLLVLVDAECAPCAAGVPGLTQLARDRKDLSVAAVFSGSRQEAMAWRLKALPGFPVAHMSARALRAYYRNLPTSLLLKDGKLVRAWWNRIPAADEVAAALQPA